MYHRTVLTRAYRPVLTHEDYMHSQIEGTSLTPGRLLTDLIRKEQDIDALDELLRLVQEQRKNSAPALTANTRSPLPSLQIFFRYVFLTCPLIVTAND